MDTVDDAVFDAAVQDGLALVPEELMRLADNVAIFVEDEPTAEHADPSLSDEEHAVTHDLTVSLMRPVAAGKRVDLTGTVLRRGRAVAFLRAEATVDGEVVAAAQVTKSVVRAS